MIGSSVILQRYVAVYLADTRKSIQELIEAYVAYIDSNMDSQGYTGTLSYEGSLHTGCEYATTKVLYNETECTLTLGASSVMKLV